LMTREQQAALPSPIRVQPVVSGSGEWVNSSVYVFKPENGLKSGTDYRVYVNEDLKDITGTRLGSAYDWGFATRAPVVMDFGLKNIGQGFVESVPNVLLDQEFLVTFSQPMDQSSVEKALKISNTETGQDIPLKLSWDNASLVLTVKSSSLLTIASFYTLTVAEGALAQDGGTFVAAYQIKLATLPLPAVVSTGAMAGKQSTYSALTSVFFNTQMKFEGMQSRVKISPEPRVPVKLFYREYQNQLDIFGLEPSRQYVIRILAGMADIYGNTTKSDYSFRVETAGMLPMAHLVTPVYPLIYRPESEQGVFFEYSNLASAKISLYSLSFEEFSALNSGTQAMDDLGEKSGKLLREWNPELLASKDRFARILVRMDDPKALAPGYYYLGLTGSPISSSHRFLQGAIFIVSGDNLALKATQYEALAWLVDSESGEPVAGMPLAFYNESWAEVGKAVTDKNGLAHLQDVEKVQYVRSMDEKHLALTALAWGSGVNEGQSGIWTDYWSPIKNIFVFTYTERPLYRPNQPVYIKGIVRTNDDLHYSLPELDQVYLSIENEQGKVFEGSVALSKNGTFTSQYQLGESAPVGNYTILVRKSAGDDTILSWSDFRVAEYVKPEFLVTATTDRPVVLTGEQVKFNLDAAYYSGGSLSKANVSWFMEMQPYYYSAPEAYSGYSFSDYDYYDYYVNGESGTKGPPVVKDGQGQTDEKGHFELVERLDVPKEGQSQQVAFSANVTDVGGNLVGSSSSVTVLGSALHAGIRPQDYIGTAGDAQVFNLVVLDMDGKPIAKQAVSVDFVEQRWFSVVRKDENGVNRWESS
ncbi:MAG: Ig-like domain-containing protein, partial [Chloroflexota bacterium]